MVTSTASGTDLEIHYQQMVACLCKTPFEGQVFLKSREEAKQLASVDSSNPKPRRLVIWVDASTWPGARRGRSSIGIAYKDPNDAGSWIKIAYRLPEVKASHEAEFLAFATALDHIISRYALLTETSEANHTITIDHLTIYTDCRGSLDLMQNFHKQATLKQFNFGPRIELANLKALVERLVGNQVNFEACWVPRGEVEGNKVADRLANTAWQSDSNAEILHFDPIGPFGKDMVVLDANAKDEYVKREESLTAEAQLRPLVPTAGQSDKLKHKTTEVGDKESITKPSSENTLIETPSIIQQVQTNIRGKRKRGKSGQKLNEDGTTLTTTPKRPRKRTRHSSAQRQQPVTPTQYSLEKILFPNREYPGSVMDTLAIVRSPSFPNPPIRYLPEPKIEPQPKRPW